MRPHGQRLGDPFPTAATVLAGVRWRHKFHSLPGPCCLGSEDRAELMPSGVADTFVEASLTTSPH